MSGPRSACHEPNTHDDPRRLDADLSTRAIMSVRDARVYTCKHVLYTISYRVHVYKITRQAHPHNVGVGVGVRVRVRVGPVEF